MQQIPTSDKKIHKWLFWWLSTRLQYLQHLCTADATVLSEAAFIFTHVWKRSLTLTTDVYHLEGKHVNLRNGVTRLFITVYLCKVTGRIPSTWGKPGSSFLSLSCWIYFGKDMFALLIISLYFTRNWNLYSWRTWTDFILDSQYKMTWQCKEPGSCFNIQ